MSARPRPREGSGELGDVRVKRTDLRFLGAPRRRRSGRLRVCHREPSQAAETGAAARSKRLERVVASQCSHACGVCGRSSTGTSQVTLDLRADGAAPSASTTIQRVAPHAHVRTSRTREQPHHFAHRRLPARLRGWCGRCPSSPPVREWSARRARRSSKPMAWRCLLPDPYPDPSTSRARPSYDES
jgi:hypothetical protein